MKVFEGTIKDICASKYGNLELCNYDKSQAILDTPQHAVVAYYIGAGLFMLFSFCLLSVTVRCVVDDIRQSKKKNDPNYIEDYAA